MPRGKLLDPARQHRTMLRKSVRQEKEAAASVGGKRHPGSGNQWHSPGDVSSSEWLVECKVTSKNQYTLKKSDVQKLIIQAVMAGKKPMMEIRYDDLSVVVLPLDVAKGLGLYASET